MKKLAYFILMTVTVCFFCNNLHALDWKFWKEKYIFDTNIYGCWETFDKDGLKATLHILENEEIERTTEKPKNAGFLDTVLERASFKYEIVGNNTIQMEPKKGLLTSTVCLFTNCETIVSFDVVDNDKMMVGTDNKKAIFYRCLPLSQKTHVLRVVSNVASASISINSENNDETPFARSLPEDKYEIVVKKEGFKNYNATINLTKDTIVKAVLEVDTASGKNNIPKSIVDGINEHLEIDKLAFHENIKDYKLKDLQKEVKKKHNYYIGEKEIIVLADLGEDLLGLSKNILFTNNLMIPFKKIRFAYPHKRLLIILLKSGEKRTISNDRMTGRLLTDTSQIINNGVLICNQ